ncbi:MAG: cofactor-independent phosphoglycerate mutase [Clostridia bacterium]|nr:cofactor-independent phosphoglycerate mutase [Clostridia bacterium]
MKYIVLLCDGMADYAVDALGGKTPMMCADKPNMDYLAKRSEVGLVKTVADGLKPGSDVANMSVMGFDPKKYYTGRSPLEAVSIGVKLKDDDVTLRCNLVTLSEEECFEDRTMVDYSAGDISTEEAAKLIEAVEAAFGNEKYKYYSGVSYRHCLVVAEGTTDLGDMTPPHDISDRVIGPYISKSENAAELIAMMKKSYDVLKNHPVNLDRISKGKRPANSIWLWGEGNKPILPSYTDLYGIEGSVISAVDLLKGIGISAGMSTPEVKGSTGYIDTNFEGKAECALRELESGKDFVYIHVEAPDECGHRNEPENKVKAIELIDEKILSLLLKGLEKYDDYKIMILPDHPTPIATKTHASDPVPYLIYHKKGERDGVECFTEEAAKATGNYIENGPSIMGKFIKEI